MYLQKAGTAGLVPAVIVVVLIVGFFVSVPESAKEKCKAGRQNCIE